MVRGLCTLSVEDSSVNAVEFERAGVTVSCNIHTLRLGPTALRSKRSVLLDLRDFDIISCHEAVASCVCHCMQTSTVSCAMLHISLCVNLKCCAGDLVTRLHMMNYVFYELWCANPGLSQCGQLSVL